MAPNTTDLIQRSKKYSISIPNGHNYGGVGDKAREKVERHSVEFLNRMVRKDIIEKMAFELRLEGGKDVFYSYTFGTIHPFLIYLSKGPVPGANS